MHRAAAVLITTLTFGSAQAADYLRGPLPEPASRPAQNQSYDWSGIYVGGQYAHGTTKFNNSDIATTAGRSAVPRSDLGDVLAGLNSLGTANGNKGGFGGYLGYNTMWDDVVLGLEGEYTRANLRANSQGPSLIGTAASLNTANGVYDYNVRTSGRVVLNDYFALKARVGWAIDRTLLFANLGVARATMSRETTSTGTWELYTTAPARATVTGVQPANGAFKQSFAKWGFVGGLGAEYALTDNIILRGDWQYLGVGSSTNSASTFKNGYLTVNTLRAGANVKF